MSNWKSEARIESQARATERKRAQWNTFVGKRFGRLTVMSATRGDERWMLLCKCDCGNEHLCSASKVRCGEMISCGCARKDSPAIKSFAKSRRHFKERRAKDFPEYDVWHGMRWRCNNPKSEKYPQYGGRGIKVCARWENFRNFVEDMGPRPSLKHSIDRIDNNGNYEPGNCRWATSQEQGENKQNTVKLTIGGVTKALVAWCRETGASYHNVHWRLKKRGEAEAVKYLSSFEKFLEAGGE